MQDYFYTTSSSSKQTQMFGETFGKCLQDGDVVLLKGDLGAGKTRFSKGVASALGITRDVISPTFNILVQYDEGAIPLFHFDLYRLEDELELEDIDFYYLVDSSTPGVCLIEWADRFLDAMPDEYLEIVIEKSSAEHTAEHMNDEKLSTGDLSVAFAVDAVSGADCDAVDDDTIEETRRISAFAKGERSLELLECWRQALGA